MVVVVVVKWCWWWPSGAGSRLGAELGLGMRQVERKNF